MTVDLNELANARGYGAAAKSLRDAGLWDEWAGMPKRRYLVTYSYTCTEAEAVSARSEDEAEQIVMRQNRGADVEIESVEPME